MNYLTVEVEIRNGKIVAREPDKLPKAATGLLTITSLGDSSQAADAAGAAEMQSLIADTWEKLGPAPEIDYDKL